MIRPQQQLTQPRHFPAINRITTNAAPDAEALIAIPNSPPRTWLTSSLRTQHSSSLGSPPVATATCSRRDTTRDAHANLDQLTTSHELHHSDQPRSTSAWLTAATSATTAATLLATSTRDSARTDHQPDAGLSCRIFITTSSAQSTTSTVSVYTRTPRSH